MYLRTGNIYKDFIIEHKDESVSSRGRKKSRYADSDANMIKAILAEADPREKERWRQLSHPISHTIVHKGSPMANTEDRLIFGGRMFYIQGIDEPGSLGLWTIYYAEERFDCHGNKD